MLIDIIIIVKMLLIQYVVCYRPAEYGHVYEGGEEHSGSGQKKVRVQQEKERRRKEKIR